MSLVPYSDDETSDVDMGPPISYSGSSTARYAPQRAEPRSDDQVTTGTTQSFGREVRSGALSAGMSRVAASIRPMSAPTTPPLAARGQTRRRSPNSPGADHLPSQFPDAPGPSRPRVLPEPDEEESRLHALLRPTPIEGVENWGIPPPVDDPCDPALVGKLSQFHALKQQGKHFNDSLMSNKAFRNPHIHAKLVEFVDVEERGTNFSKELWDPFDVRKEWFADQLAEAQKKRSEELEASQARGKRSHIDFAASKPPPAPEKPHRPHPGKERDTRYEPYPPAQERERGRDGDGGKRGSRWDVDVGNVRGKSGDRRRDNEGR